MYTVKGVNDAACWQVATHSDKEAAFQNAATSASLYPGNLYFVENADGISIYSARLVVLDE